MFRRPAILALLVLLAGCAAGDPLPDGYAGPVARIEDSFFASDPAVSHVFYLEAIDGETIRNGLGETAQASRGTGPITYGKGYARDVPAREAGFTIAGVNYYAMPLLGMINASWDVSGTTRFAPEAGRTYVVKGRLGPGYSAVWIEDKQTGAQVGDKIERREQR